MFDESSLLGRDVYSSMDSEGGLVINRKSILLFSSREELMLYSTKRFLNSSKRKRQVGG